MALFSASVTLFAADKGAVATNGNSARPFYIFAHNPNKLIDILDALSAGANALEPDVNIFDPGFAYCGFNPGTSGLFIHHDSTCSETETIVTLEAYLDEVYYQVKYDKKNLALIVFDIKPNVTSNKLYFKNLVIAVQTHLNHDGVQIPVIYSVGSIGEAANFFVPEMVDQYSGVMVDGDTTTDNDAYGVWNLLYGLYSASGHTPINLGYGNGGVDLDTAGTAEDKVWPNIDQAVYLRSSARQVADGANYTIPYAYTVSQTSTMNEFITAGVDGLIPDKYLNAQWNSDTATLVRTLEGIVKNSEEVYLATSADTPFHRAMEAYGLKVNTADEANAGTDSKLTFTLQGACGRSSVTYDTSYRGRMERGMTNYVTIPSMNLGPLVSLTIHSDGSGTGPGWIPASVEISSTLFGVSPTELDLSDTSIGGSGEPNTVGLDLTSYQIGRAANSCPPKVTAYQTPQATMTGWSNFTGATYTMNWTSSVGFDASQTNCPLKFSIANVPEGTFSKTFSCTDRLGQTGSTTWKFKVDTTPPVAAPTQFPPPNAAGWTNKFPIAISPNWVDPNIGLDSGLDYDCFSTDTISQIAPTLNPATFRYSCHDNAGNAGYASWTVKWDVVSPKIQCPHPDLSWVTSFTEHCTATDDVSGPVVPVGATNGSVIGLKANFDVTLAGTTGVESANNSLPVTVCDNASNCSTATISGIHLDNKAPAIAISTPLPNQVFTRGVDTLTLNYTVTDGGSGVRSGSVVTRLNGSDLGHAGASGQKINLNSLAPGRYSLQIDADDNVRNHASTTVVFTVRANGAGGR